MAAKTQTQPFAHLHLHSEYSLLDGGNRIDKLVQHIKALGMTSCAITDHGNLFGAVAFYKACKANDIKPILGIEAYVAPDINGQVSDRCNKEFTGVSDGGFHLVLLAENNTGWQNLLKLSSDAYIEGFYFKPRMDKQTLAEWSQGIIAINGHLGSSLAHHLTNFERTGHEEHFERARAEAIWHRDTFGTNEQGEPCFYLEVQSHGVPEQDAINPHIYRLSEETGIPVVCDNDAHFMTAEDWDAHDTLICVSMGKLKEDEDRLHYPKELYVKSPQQMWERFADRPDVLENTIKIADRCEVDLDFEANHAPVVKIMRKQASDLDKHPRGSTEWYKAFCAQFELVPFDSSKDSESAEELKEQCDAALRELCEAGLVWRYGDHITDDHRARLERELGILADKLISAYFLIVWDFVNEARSRGIPANARGSGVGTMVGYVLGLSNACPVEYGLLFERFTDPDRSEYPDIDIDMCQDGRQEIIEYVREKYGYVAQIITFGTMKARAAIRDVGRVHNLPLSDVDKVCKLIGDGLGVTLNKALEQEPDLKKLYDEDVQVRDVIDTAKRLEGISRHSGVHAAGVILATQPLQNIVPLAISKQGQKTITVTQWDGPTCESVGLLKMDFLGLRTLSIIERARQFIRATLEPHTIRQTVRAGRTTTAGDDTQTEEPANWDPLDLERLTYDDPKVFALYQRAETAGTFQFESDGMRNMLLQMKPDRLEDLIAGNALFRPGPMALIDDYCDRKHGVEKVPEEHPIVDKFTAPTYGIMVYQEQVMQIVHELGGIPLRQAYSLIKAISKKKEKIINANRAEFLDGAEKQGLSRERGEKLFDLILRFAGYGFNKSHSAGYSIVAYQTAYLKTYFPVQYMAAVLTYESHDTEKVVKYMDECRRVLRPGGTRGIEVKPPSINQSHVGFTVVFDEGEAHDANHGHIRFGLGAVKGVGEKAILAIIASREKDGAFDSLYDFCERVDLRAVNRSTIEALIKAGAFDDVHGMEKRSAMVEGLDSAIQAGQRAAADRSSGQMNFFGGMAAEAGGAGSSKPVSVPLPDVKPWSTKVQLDHEKQVLGFYLSSNPLDEHRELIDTYSNANIAQIKQLTGEVQATVGAMLTRLRPTFTKKGKSAGSKMAMITIEDASGEKLDGVIFSDTYAVVAPLLETDATLFFKGKVDRRREEPSLIVNDVIALEEAREKLTEAVTISLRDPNPRANDNGNGRMMRLNGELQALRSLIQQSRPRNGDTAADVFFEVSQGGRLTRLKANNLRVKVDADLPDRIAAVLHMDSCCRLQGPRKLAVATVNQGFTPGVENRLRRDDGIDDEFCDSIDRY